MTHPSFTLTDVIEYADKRFRDVNHTRKYTGDPYIVHPLEVMSFHIAYTQNPIYRELEQLAAAVLHDTVEDTVPRHFEEDTPEYWRQQHLIVSEIKDLFGVEVARRVYGLSDQVIKSTANRKTRKKWEADRLGREDHFVQTAKALDLTSNTKAIAYADEKFAKVYLPEKRYVLSQLTAADPGALYIARRTLEEAETHVYGPNPCFPL